MHLAHQELFKKLDNNGAIAVICTGYANLTIKTYRERHTKYPLFFYPLADIKHLSGEEFITLLKEEFPSLEKIVVGYDFHFGHKASSDTEDLRAMFDGKVEVVNEFSVDNLAVHSRLIREYLRTGDITTANKLLGYNYSLVGYSISGQGLGKKQFVPTINLDVQDFLIPSEGIYITKTVVNGKKYNSVSFIGHRVTTDGKFACETHIINDGFKQEVPHLVEIEFFEKLRDNKKYEQYSELKAQILLDIENTKKYFKKVN